SGHRVADWLAGRATGRTWRVCRRRSQRLAAVVLEPGPGRGMAGSLAGAPCHLAHAGPDDRGDDVQRGLPVDPLSLTDFMTAESNAWEPLSHTVVAWLRRRPGAMIRGLRRKR